MNRNHSRRTPLSAKAALAVLLASSFMTVAQAQDAGVQLAPPDANQQMPGALQPAQPEFKLPAGASVGDAQDKIKKLSAEGAQSLKALQGNAVSNEREMNDVESRSKDLREIQSLTMQVEKAKLAKDLYQIINGDEDKNKEELETVKNERDELSIQVKSLEDQLIATNKQLQSEVVKPKDPNPVVVSVVGSGGNLSAKVLVPYYGEATVRKGDVLANGQTVSSITSNGVTVSRDGKTEKLAFGTSVPAAPKR